MYFIINEIILLRREQTFSFSFLKFHNIFRIPKLLEINIANSDSFMFSRYYHILEKCDRIDM